MLVHCPKCGFQQPDDQYCARCGVDMKSYRPSQLNQSKKLFQKTGVFQIIIFLAVLAGVSWWIGKNKSSQQWVQKLNVISKSTRLQNHESQNTAVNDASSHSDSEDKVQVEVDPNANLDSLAQPQAPQARTANPDGTAATASIEARELSGDKTNAQNSLMLSFIEVPKTILISWMSEAQARGLFQNYTDFSAGILLQKNPQFDQQIKYLKTESIALGNSKMFAHVFGKANEDTNEFNGLQTQIEIKAKENNLLKGHFSITKSIKNSKESIPAEFELQKGHVFFILWKSALQGFEDDVNLSKIPPFQVIQSPEYLNQRTEFVILIEPQ